MALSVTIMAHPRRLPWAEDLAERLRCGVTLDKIQDRHETGLRCLQAGLEFGASHHLIVQDDAIVAPDLIAGLERAVQFSQDRIVGLYVGNVRPEARTADAAVKQARASGVSWLALPGPWWGVGIVIPTVHLPELIAHYSASKENNYDRRIETWARKAKVECWYTMPSLVDHRSGEDNPSLVAGRTSTTRTARWFTGGSALDVDWSRIPRAPHLLWRHVKTGRVQKVRAHSPQMRRLESSGQYEPVVEDKCGECGSPRYLPVEGVPDEPRTDDDATSNDHLAHA